MYKKSMFFVVICALLLITACNADDTAKSSDSNKNKEKDSVHIQEEKVEQKTNPATVEVDNS
ncbi:hypothetical protein CHH83_24805 [Bacillus sp. 7586-K]|uniref:hypothetical protein n=1 Tax=Metabacillus niabensis TaxID=324854 RepID=UPI000BA7C362|nr:hypothetical protein CHH83_24805 [Bacillus sp. 7586-K]